ncbi:hypothetical protein M422DRAFT_60123 [Sphaerobolus stellatus SS14]|uniref:F-box domain-containing protein n=1 Tax=Sphaerobolus stellatus (strain SS14) TaxID=990650 RepID=A0A0C9VBI6_SPHS4|nr:hypothetical protein M422DRAFT_60123 [Sphaerobolus stellatus SS14]
MQFHDEGYDEHSHSPLTPAFPGRHGWVEYASLRDKEELALQLLSSLPISSLARVQRRIAPLLQFDIIGSLPTEVALNILSFLQCQDLLACSLVCRRWRDLADDSSLWKQLCSVQGWEWRESTRHRFQSPALVTDFHDEGVGEEEPEWSSMEMDSGYATMTMDHQVFQEDNRRVLSNIVPITFGTVVHYPLAISPFQASVSLKPDYKLLHQTHILLRNRLLHSSYHLRYLQVAGSPNGHTALIYCLQLHTFPDTPESPSRQVLFTGSRDYTIRLWDLSSGTVERVYEGIHDGSVLSICVQGNYLISGGGDRKVVVWDIGTGEPVKVMNDHLDSVLCVRADKTRLVTCSKDRTVRTYLFPDLAPHLVLDSHRAAVNAVSISSTQIVSASGDRSVRVWDVETGALVHSYEHHHSRGIASIDFAPPYIVSGSSDKYVRYFNLLTSLGWSTSPHLEPYSTNTSTMCHACGTRCDFDEELSRRDTIKASQAHRELVRSVHLGEFYVVSGSYDQTIKVWDRTTGNLLVDLKGGHNGKVFCVTADCTKIVSCGEDMRICIWDFAHDITTSFIYL